MARYVAYFRVSTEKQGKSGLGLAAQHSLIERFLSEGDEVIAEYVEVQSGKNDERVELWKAINHAKRNDAKLLIAKLDRFSRKVSFIASIMEQGIGLVVAEMPNATDFQLHIDSPAMLDAIKLLHQQQGQIQAMIIQLESQSSGTSSAHWFFVGAILAVIALAIIL